LGPYHHLGDSVYRRDFSAGTAIVNAAQNGSATIELGGTYLDHDGKPVTQVTLGSTRGAILRAAGAPSPIIIPLIDRFTDIVGNVHHDSIKRIAELGIAMGGPAGTEVTEYGPSLDVRRGQMATFIARTIDEMAPGLLPATDGTNDFPCDVGAGNVHFDSIQRLAAAGIVQGDPGGLDPGCYGPDQPVRRDQMAAFINRAIAVVSGSQLTSMNDAFGDDGASVHEASINGLASGGIVRGNGEGIYDPAGSVRRDQMASFIARSVDHLSRPE
jgi:hypothetical protein